MKQIRNMNISSTNFLCYIILGFCLGFPSNEGYMTLEIQQCMNLHIREKVCLFSCVIAYIDYYLETISVHLPYVNNNEEIGVMHFDALLTLDISFIQHLFISTEYKNVVVTAYNQYI